jgi:hypothetical protein
MPADRVSTAAPRSQGSDSLIDLWLAWWRILGLKAPLSGDVLQHLVDPSLLRDNAQLGLLNINAMQSPDPVFERRIITEVASYGRQLGRLVEAVDVLARRQERVGMPVDDQRALDQLQDLAQQIAATKTKEDRGPDRSAPGRCAGIAQGPKDERRRVGPAARGVGSP